MAGVLDKLSRGAQQDYNSFLNDIAFLKKEWGSLKNEWEKQAVIIKIGVLANGGTSEIHETCPSAISDSLSRLDASLKNAWASLKENVSNPQQLRAHVQNLSSILASAKRRWEAIPANDKRMLKGIGVVALNTLLILADPLTYTLTTVGSYSLSKASVLISSCLPNCVVEKAKAISKKAFDNAPIVGTVLSAGSAILTRSVSNGFLVASSFMGWCIGKSFANGSTELQAFHPTTTRIHPDRRAASW